MNSNYICISYIHGNSICICTTVLMINIKLYFMFLFKIIRNFSDIVYKYNYTNNKKKYCNKFLSILLFLLVHFVFVIFRILYIIFYNDMIRNKKKQCENKNYYFHFNLPLLSSFQMLKLKNIEALRSIYKCIH